MAERLEDTNCLPNLHASACSSTVLCCRSEFDPRKTRCLLACLCSPARLQTANSSAEHRLSSAEKNPNAALDSVQGKFFQRALLEKKARLTRC